MEEIKSSLINSKYFKYLKESLIRASQFDKHQNFRVKTVEYINDTASNNADMFFYDRLEYLRFLSAQEGRGHIAFTTPDGIIYMVCPDAEHGPGLNVRVWDFIYCHECLHQLWDTWEVGEKIKKEGYEYDHNLLNIASDCIINDYLHNIRKKERYENGIFPESLKDEYGIEYDRRKDNQFTLYLKLLEFKKANKKAYDKMMQDPVYNGKILPNHVEQGHGIGGQQPPQDPHSPDFIKGWTQAINDVVSKKIDPIQWGKDHNIVSEAKSSNNSEYDNGYNAAMKEIINGILNGIKISSGGFGSGGQSGDLPQIPWDTPPQQSQGGESQGSGQGSGSGDDSQQSSEDAAKQAQQSADEAKNAASQAQSNADKSGNESDKAAADKAKQAAEKAQQAADKAKKAAQNGDNNEANSQAQQAAEAAAEAKHAATSTMNPTQASDNAQQAADAAKAAAEEAQKNADAASGASGEQDKKNAQRAKEAAEKAADAAKKAQEAADEAAEAAKRGDAKAAQDAAKKAEQQKSIAEDNARIAKNAKEGKMFQKGNAGNPSANQAPSKGRGDEAGEWPPKFESEADMEEIRRESKENLDEWRKKVGGDLGTFNKQCSTSAALKKEGIQVNTTTRANTGWDEKMNVTINGYVKKRVFQKRRQYQKTYSRIRRGSGPIQFGKPLEPGRRVKEDKLTIDVAFYVDRSSSMGSSIDLVFKAAYTIADAIKKRFGKDPVVDKTKFSMFNFDMSIHELEWGHTVNASGGTLPFEQLFEFIKNNTGKYLINVIITDGESSVDKNAAIDLLKDIEGIILFIANRSHPEMENLAKKYDTKLFFIKSDPDFTLDKDIK